MLSGFGKEFSQSRFPSGFAMNPSIEHAIKRVTFAIIYQISDKPDA
jgi:hypothetical protein